MNLGQESALQNAAASSAMEDLPLEQYHLEIIQNILDGKLSLEDYLQSIRGQEQEN